MIDHAAAASANHVDAGGQEGGRVRTDPEIRPLLMQLCGERDPSEADLDVFLARAVWSRLAEPGDATAGALLARLGPTRALEVLGNPAAARALAQQHTDSDGGGQMPTGRQLGAAIKRWRPRLDREATVGDLKSAVAAGMTLLAPESAGWPGQLNDLGAHSPAALWVRGDARLLGGAALAVVGARACTGYGSHVTAELTATACSAGLTIVSGAAYGVDAVAHRTALATDSPTVAVLAGGSDRAYPAAHDQLLGRVVAQGAVCSELVPGAAPTRWRFLQRNRIIAALSGAVLVTEAGVRSGALNTAGHAAEIGRPIGAVPGPITSAASAGCHRIVRDYGATLVTTGQELLELLGAAADPLIPGTSDTAEDVAGPARQPALHTRLLDALPIRGGRTLAAAARVAGTSTDEAANTLAELELLGYVARQHPPDGSPDLWVLRKRE